MDRLKNQSILITTAYFGGEYGEDISDCTAGMGPWGALPFWLTFARREAWFPGEPGRRACMDTQSKDATVAENRPVYNLNA
jgi:hypothetical protein